MSLSGMNRDGKADLVILVVPVDQLLPPVSVPAATLWTSDGTWHAGEQFSMFSARPLSQNYILESREIHQAYGWTGIINLSKASNSATQNPQPGCF